MTKKQTTKKENYEKEEWGGWKIVSDMLDHPDKNRTYQTSECYQKLYDFVMAQKRQARQRERKRVKEMILEMMENWEKRFCNDKHFNVLEDIKDLVNKLKESK